MQVEQAPSRVVITARLLSKFEKESFEQAGLAGNGAAELVGIGVRRQVDHGFDIGAGFLDAVEERHQVVVEVITHHHHVLCEILSQC